MKMITKNAPRPSMLSFKSVLIGCLLALAGALSSPVATASQVQAIVKLPPLRTLTDKTMGVIRKVHPGQEMEFLAFALLGGFGYPSFPNVSPTEPMGILLLEGEPENPFPFVIMVKPEGGDQIRQIIQAQFGWNTQDQDGWILIAQNPAYFSQLPPISDVEALLRELKDYDIQGRTFSSPEKLEQMHVLLEGSLLSLIEKALPDTDPAIPAAYLKVIQSILSNMEWTEVGLNLSPETISVAYGAKARENTPEYNMLSNSTSHKKVEFANLIPAEGDFISLGNVNQTAINTYILSLFERLKTYSPESHRAQVEETKNHIIRIIEPYDGQSAGTAKIDKEDVKILSIYGAKFTEDSYEKLAHSTFAFSQNVINNFFQTLSSSANLPNTPLITYQIEKQTVDGINKPVFKLTKNTLIQSTSAEVDVEGQNTETVEKAIENVYETTVTWNILFPDFLLGGTDLDELKTLTRRIEAGEKASPSIESKLPGSPDHLLEAELGIAHFTLLAIIEQAKSLFGGDISQELQAKINDFKSKPLQPLFASAKAGNGTGSFQLDIPVNTIATVMRFQQTVQEEMMRQMLQKQMEATSSEM